MNNLFSMNDENSNQNVTIESFSDETRSLTKKRKLSNGETSSRDIELKYLKLEKEEWKQLAQNLEAEKRQHIDGCNAEKILELEDTVKMLQTIIAKNDEEKRQHQAQMNLLNFAIEEHITKVETLEDEKRKSQSKIKELTEEISTMKNIKMEIKDSVENETAKLKAEINELKKQAEIIEDEKRKDESKIQELDEEISTMKNIKMEIKDSVENERETCESETIKLKEEINELKNKNNLLEVNNQKFVDVHSKEIIRLKEEKYASEKRLKEEKKKFEIETKNLKSEIYQLKNQNSALEKSVRESESQRSVYEKRFTEDQKKYAETFAANQQLEQKCKEFETEKKIEKRGKKELEKVVSLNEIFDDSKLNDALFSCKSNIVVNIAKLVGNSSEVWEIYSTITESKKSFLLTEEEMIRNCFKMNINGQLSVQTSDLKLQLIMHKINSCSLTKLELSWQTIDFEDYVKLTESKKIEICILENCTVLKKPKISSFHKECNLDELLSHLPNITEFKYKYGCWENYSTLAKNLGQLDPFPNLQKFEISDLTESFKFKDLKTFLNKNNKNISYIFVFSDETPKNMQKEIEAAKNKLLKSLSFPCEIRLGFEGDDDDDDDDDDHHHHHVWV